MRTFISDSWHYIVGLATMGLTGGLMINGNVSATAGLPIITGVASALIGGKLALLTPNN